MGRTDRLLNLVALLRDASRPVSADRIHAEVAGYPVGNDAFRRAFSRDKEILRDMGMPIVLEPLAPNDGPGEGYLIPADRYELDDLGFDDAELEALHVASSLVRVGEVGVDTALWKLGGAVGPGANELAHVGLDPSVLAVFSALEHERDVTFDYRGTRRVVAPGGLRLRSGRWYVSGYDRGRKAQRLFRVDRIEGDVTVVDRPAGDQGPAGVAGLGRAAAPEPERSDDEAAATGEWARIWISSLHAWRVERDMGPAAIAERHDDGSVVIRLQIGDIGWTRDWVLGFGPDAEVLEPSSLRDAVVSWLAAVIEQSAKSAPA